MASRTLIISNETSGYVSDADGAAFVAALQKQVDNDFAPKWLGLRGDLVYWPTSKGAPPKGQEIYHLLRNATQAGMLGYHELNPAGYPEGFIFCQTSAEDNSPWQVTGSHEVLEGLLDPYASLTVQAGSGTSTAWAMFEGCDAVEDDNYAINAIPLSSFLLPTWFQENSSGPYDKLDKLSKPFSIDAGGYVAYADGVGNWHQFTGSASRHKGPTPYSRHARYQIQAHRAERGLPKIAGMINWQSIFQGAEAISQALPGLIQAIGQVVAAWPVAARPRNVPFSQAA